MSLQNKAVAVAACFAAAALSWQSASAADFTFNEKTNADLAKKLKIPVYFAVPKSTWAKLPDIKTTDKLVEFKHPDGMKAKGDVGLRLVVAKRSRSLRAPRQERAAADRRHHADVPLRVGRRRRLSQHPDGHLAHWLCLHRQERQPAQSRQPDGRRIRRPRQPDERALPHAQLPAHHPPAQPDGRAERQPAGLGDEAQRQRRQDLSEPDQLQSGLPEAEISVERDVVRQGRSAPSRSARTQPASRSTCTARSSCSRCCRYATAIR